MKIDARETGEYEVKCPICGEVIQGDYSETRGCEHLVLIHCDAVDFFLKESPEMLKRMIDISQDIVDRDELEDITEVDSYEILEKLKAEHPEELLIELTTTGSGCSGPSFPVTDTFFFKTP
tara:strand:- start:167 stop:529 length:363 start_codon:yes stop_codon:yes gene_type:complete